MQGVSSGQYCAVHGIEKTYWHKHPSNPSGGSWECRVCNKEDNARNNPRNNARPEIKQSKIQHSRTVGYARQRETNWRKQGIVGLTYEHYQAQATHCRICGSTEKLVADHDHTTHQFRGVLCTSCNHMLGNAKDNPVLLHCAELYLGGTPCH